MKTDGENDDKKQSKGASIPSPGLLVIEGSPVEDDIIKEEGDKVCDEVEKPPGASEPSLEIIMMMIKKK